MSALPGIWHIAGPDLMSRYDLALLAARAFGIRQDLIQPVLTVDLAQRAARPLRAGLRTGKIAGFLGGTLRSTEDCLSELARIETS